MVGYMADQPSSQGKDFAFCNNFLNSKKVPFGPKTLCMLLLNLIKD